MELVKKESDTVNHSNKLLLASYKLSLLEFRIMIFALKDVNSRFDKPEFINIKSVDFAKEFNYEENNMCVTLRKAIKTINKTPIVILELNEKNKLQERSFHWFDETIVPVKHDGLFKVKFSKQISPYLFELKNGYSISHYEKIKHLTSLQFRLYQWLKDAKYINKDIKGGSYEVSEFNAESLVLSVEWIKQQGGIGGKYQVWADLNKRVLKPAIDNINATTDLSVFYEPVRVGRKIEKVKFFYINESKKTSSNTVPLRPRLRRKPHAVEGSAKMGDWARVNIKLLKNYEKAATKYDNTFKLEFNDLKRLVEYYSITGDQDRKAEVENVIKKRKAAQRNKK